MLKLVLICIILNLINGTLQGSTSKTQNEVSVNRIGKTFDTPEGRITFSNEKLDWVEAMRVCNAEEMTLVTLDTLRKNTLVKDLLVSNGLTDPYWTSANHIQGDFYWTSIGFPIKNSVFSDWHTGEPNENWLEYLCVVTNQTGWADSDCYNQNYFICE